MSPKLLFGIKILLLIVASLFCLWWLAFIFVLDAGTRTPHTVMRDYYFLIAKDAFLGILVIAFTTNRVIVWKRKLRSGYTGLPNQ